MDSEGLCEQLHARNVSTSFLTPVIIFMVWRQSISSVSGTLRTNKVKRGTAIRVDPLRTELCDDCSKDTGKIVLNVA